MIFQNIHNETRGEISFNHFEFNGLQLLALLGITFTLSVKLMWRFALRIVGFFTFYRNKTGSRFVLRNVVELFLLLPTI